MPSSISPGVPAGTGRRFCDALLCFAEAFGCQPDAGVAVSEAARAFERRLASPADEDGHRAEWLRVHRHVIELEVLSGEAHVVLGPQPLQDLDCLVRPRPAGGGVHARTPELVRVFAAHADAEHEPPMLNWSSCATCSATGTGWRNGKR